MFRLSKAIKKDILLATSFFAIAAFYSCKNKNLFADSTVNFNGVTYTGFNLTWDTIFVEMHSQTHLTRLIATSATGDTLIAAINDPVRSGTIAFDTNCIEQSKPHVALIYTHMREKFAYLGNGSFTINDSIATFTGSFFFDKWGDLHHGAPLFKTAQASGTFYRHK